MTDHYAETNRLIDGLRNLEGHNADFDMALAQVHATLALAEQQRIANLIALANARHMNEAFDDTTEASREAAYALIEYAILPGSPTTDEDEYAAIHPVIARALRIENQ